MDKQLLQKALENNKDLLVNTLAELIRFPTTKGNEEEAQSYFAQKLRDLGCEVEQWEPDIDRLRTLPGFYSERENFKGSPVVGAKYKGVGGGKSILLSGHMDVVPAVKEFWTMDPFAGIVKDGKVYGRGAADMKGGIAANYIALKSILDAGIKLKGDVLVETTIDEECGNTGVMALTDRGYVADAAIVSEPTSLDMNVATCGNRWFSVSVPGKAAHGGLAFNGMNSIYKAMILINAIRDLEERRRLRLYDELYADKPIPFCVGVNTIRAGEWHSTVPSETVFTGRLGVSPGETVEEVVAEFEDAVFSAAKADHWLRDHMPTISYFPSLWNSGRVDPAHPLARIIDQNTQDIAKRPSRCVGMCACSDSGTLVKMGDTPAINFGPNSMDMAHQNDEYVDIESLFQCAQIIANSIVEWCEMA